MKKLPDIEYIAEDETEIEFLGYDKVFIPTVNGGVIEARESINGLDLPDGYWGE